MKNRREQRIEQIKQLVELTDREKQVLDQYGGDRPQGRREIAEVAIRLRHFNEEFREDLRTLREIDKKLEAEFRCTWELAPD